MPCVSTIPKSHERAVRKASLDWPHTTVVFVDPFGATLTSPWSQMVLKKGRGTRPPKWLWLAVRETLLVGWSANAFGRKRSGAKEVPENESAFEYVKKTWMAEPYRVDITVYEGALDSLHFCGFGGAVDAF